MLKRLLSLLRYQLWQISVLLRLNDHVSLRNIVFVIDDLRFDGLGFLTPEVLTPNIDQLAAEGVYFSNAVVTTSLCSPSRATISRDLRPKSQIVDNNDTTEEGLVFSRYLQEAGYETGFLVSGIWDGQMTHRAKGLIDG